MPLWRRLAIAGAILAALAAGLAFAGWPGLTRSGNGPYLTYLGIIFVVLLSGALLRERMSVLAVRAVIWLGVLLTLVLGYEFRHDFGAAGERALGALIPSYGYQPGDASVSFRSAADGHYRVNARVDGTAILFMVDTGASGIVLTRSDAARLGFRPTERSYDRSVSTANGMTRAATVRLRELTIGPITLNDISALVNEGELAQSLLGMRFLERVGAIEIRDGILTLRR